MFDDIIAHLPVLTLRETNQFSFSIPLCCTIYDLKDIYLLLLFFTSPVALAQLYAGDAWFLQGVGGVLLGTWKQQKGKQHSRHVGCERKVAVTYCMHTTGFLWPH